jgi:DNA-binding CsgD family transcriptional regulator/catechol 2,3-dioxygenase-like lactoylglutathione lyase family enzyme
MTERKERGRPPHPDVLTPAEWRVAEAVRHGMSNPEIARRQGVTIDAVKYHVANALSKLGFSSRRELRQWDGVRCDSALFGRGNKMPGDTTLGAIGQIARGVKDIAAASKFYGEVLGLPHLYTFGNLAFFDCDGTRLFLSQGDGGGDSASILYFRVPDIHAAHAALSERGAVFVNAPHMIHKHEDGTEEWMAFFNDNEGRPLAIMAQAKPA